MAYSLYTRVADLIGDTVFSASGGSIIYQLDSNGAVVNDSDGNPVILFDASATKYRVMLTRFAKQAIRDVVDRQLTVNPKDMHLFTQNTYIKPMGKWGDVENPFTFGEHNIPWKDNDGGFAVDNNYVLWVGRQYGGIQVPCHEVSAEKGLRVQDPDSIYYTGTDFRNPVFWRSSSKLYISPDISIQDEGRASLVKFDEHFDMDSINIAYFPEHLLFLVVLYICARALKVLLGQKRSEYNLNYSSPLVVWKALYGDTAALPVLPTFPTTLPDFGSTFSLDYLFPSIDFGSGTAEKETVETVLKNIWNRIHEEEETDLVSAELNRYNTIFTEYNTRLATLEKRHQIQMGEFSAQMGEFQQKFSTVMDVWTRYQASYKIDVELLTGEIARLDAEYMKHFYPKHYQEKMKEEGST
jgi:hypothetical protein